MSNTKKILLTLVVVGATGAVAALGVFAAFTSTTANPGNSIAAGTLTLADNDAGSALYAVGNAKPGSSATRCIKVTYSGSLDAGVRLYASDPVGALGQYVDLTITPGSFAGAPPADMACTGFSADSGGAIFSDTLESFAGTYTGWSSGLADNPVGATKWVQNDSVVYRVTVTLQNGAPNAVQGTSTGSHSITWEARDQ